MHVSGTYKDGSVLLDEPVDWPEGTHVDVVSLASGVGAGECLDGTRWPNSEEEIRNWLRWFDDRKPLMSETEFQAFETLRKEESISGRLMWPPQESMARLLPNGRIREEPPL